MRFVSGLIASLVLASAPLVAPVTAFAKESVVAVAGKPIYSADKRNLGSIYLVTLDGSAKIFVGSKIVTIPGSTITLEKGRIVTSLTKDDVKARR